MAIPWSDNQSINQEETHQQKLLVLSATSLDMQLPSKLAFQHSLQIQLVR